MVLINLFSGEKWRLKNKLAIHFTVLAGRIPWTEEPGRLQSMESQRFGHDWATNGFTFTVTVKIPQLKGSHYHYSSPQSPPGLRLTVSPFCLLTAFFSLSSSHQLPVSHLPELSVPPLSIQVSCTAGRFLTI